MANNYQTRVCSSCNRNFEPSSRHLKCPSCRDNDKRKTCPDCGNLMRAKSSKCILCFGKQNAFENNGNWKGGTTRHQKGYVLVRYPDHPRSINGYVFEHILVMEESLGRYLTEEETVHHKNGVRDDNSLTNLELWTRPQPAGVRVSDLVKWSENILTRYAPEKLK